MQNDGVNKSDILQNQFTAYLKKAIRNSKIQYLKAKEKQRQLEISLELQDYFTEFMILPDMLIELPIIEQIESYCLQRSLCRLKKKELHILFSKVLQNQSFVEIANELGLSYKSTTQIYYRMIRKIKNEIQGEQQ